MKKILLISLLFIAGLITDGLSQDHYQLATDIDGVPVESETIKTKRTDVAYISFKLSKDSKYVLLLDSNKDVKFEFLGNAFIGNFQEITFTTDKDYDMTFVVKSVEDKRFKLAYVLSYVGPVENNK